MQVLDENNKKHGIVYAQFIWFQYSQCPNFVGFWP